MPWGCHAQSVRRLAKHRIEKKPMQLSMSFLFVTQNRSTQKLISQFDTPLAGLSSVIK
ncbi:MAG: hypothetical protein ACJASB_000221 [Shewanella psychromarinicola]|jgi:hypothetical protein